ncbi:amidohydrolase family protein [Parasphingorhabdus halotolerans]|uniref:Amidohydrolase family protein n=1 Tax=Parasphingorhabdus halotolerans TaxID=2725558 RepID=A0A6H2DLP2_9SPHN|nr:amidohydrolase family protein [Parasphingorhabdus halotolerans]QJB68576.1 amidohydrolase family protein [Parasphingorhabdus halotolerans]
MMKFGALLLSSIALTAASAAAETIAITGGKVVIGDGTAPIDGGTVIMTNDRVVAAGLNIAIPANARRIDASGKWVTPGIFAGFSRVGLVEVGAVSQTNDVNARGSVFSSAIDVQYAVNPFASAVSVNRAAGVTRAVVSPSTATSIFGGYGAIIDLGQDNSPITKAKAFQFVELGETGHSRAGGSRAATHILFRALLDEASSYARAPASFESDLLTKSDAKALLPVINGSVQLLVHVESANDILKVLDIKKEFPALNMVLVGASEGWRVANEIAAARVPVLASALNDLPDRFESLSATQSNIGRMKAAGVNVAIGMINDRDEHQLRYSVQYAGNLVALNKVPRATGLSWDEAFAAISSKPAEIMGMGAQLGSLKAGRKGDVVIWTGDPLELSTQVEMVFVDGVQQSLSNRQERLRERYRNPAPGSLPKAYDR